MSFYYPREKETEPVMRNVVVFGLSVALGFGCFAFGQDGIETINTTAPPEIAIAAPVVELSAEDSAQIDAALAACADAYRKAEHMRDSIIFRSPDPFTMEITDQHIRIDLYTGTDALLHLAKPGYTFFSVDEYAYVLNRLSPSMYARMSMRSDLDETMSQGGGPGLVIPHFALRKATNAAQMRVAVSKTMQNPVFAGYTLLSSDDDTAQHEIHILGDNGELFVYVDKDTSLIQNMVTIITPGGDHPDATMEFIFSPEFDDSFVPPSTLFIKFRDKVDTVQELKPTPLYPGDHIPDYLMKNLEGEEVWISQYEKPQITVIGFFNSAVADQSQQMLDALQELSLYSKESDVNMNIVAINVLEEETEDWDLRRKKAMTMLEGKELDYEILVDLSNICQQIYGISHVPSVLIVDNELTYRKMFLQADATKVKNLKYIIGEILEGKPMIIPKRPDAPASTGHEGHDH